MENRDAKELKLRLSYFYYLDSAMRSNYPYYAACTFEEFVNLYLGMGQYYDI